MWKQCPHCHADSFDERDLIDLSYFRPTACKSCGRVVSNDGFRQLLIFPAFFGALFVSFLALSFGLPEPFALLLTIVLMAAAGVALAKPVRNEQHELSLTPFDPNIENDKTILVSGWNEVELREIADGFIAGQNAAAPPSGIELHESQENCYRLMFPQDIHPSVFAALINYLLYPTEFPMPDRSITVAAKTTLNSAFEGIPESLCGQKAVLYIPEDDQDHDVVYLQTESGVNLAYSFLKETGWRPVTNARLSFDVKRLMEIT